MVDGSTLAISAPLSLSLSVCAAHAQTNFPALMPFKARFKTLKPGSRTPPSRWRSFQLTHALCCISFFCISKFPQRNHARKKFHIQSVVVPIAKTLDQNIKIRCRESRSEEQLFHQCFRCNTRICLQTKETHPPKKKERKTLHRSANKSRQNHGMRRNNETQF